MPRQKRQERPEYHDASGAVVTFAARRHLLAFAVLILAVLIVAALDRMSVAVDGRVRVVLIIGLVEHVLLAALQAIRVTLRDCLTHGVIGCGR